MHVNKSVLKSKDLLAHMVIKSIEFFDMFLFWWLLFYLKKSINQNTFQKNLNFFKFSYILALKKMVVNHIDKTFVTSDAATILK